MAKKSDSNQSEEKNVELTQDGLLELKDELKELEEVKMPKIIERVSNAREQGDLSENADYLSAKDEQNILQARIDEVSNIISKARVVKQATSHAVVGMGSTVTLTMSRKPGKKLTYIIVGEFQSDPAEGKVSSVSPLGKALVGKKKGDAIKVKAPMGEVEYKIVDIK